MTDEVAEHISLSRTEVWELRDLLRGAGERIAELEEQLQAALAREAGTQDALDEMRGRVAELESHLQPIRDERDYYRAQRDRWKARATELDAALVEHHAVGAMDGALVGDRCPVCARLGGA